MEALVLSCSTGGGHNAAAKAIVEQLKEHHHHVVFFDPYSLKSKHLAHQVGETYIKTVQMAPRLFGLIYKIGKAYSNMQHILPIDSPVYLVQKKSAQRLKAYLDEHHFDAIITPHLFCGEILSQLKRQNYQLPPIYFIATDYTCIPFEEEIEVDSFVIPSKDLEAEFKKAKVKAKEILPFGIPTKKGFHEPIAKNEAKRKLGLDENKKYILIAGGSIGVGDINETIDTLQTFLLSHRDHELIILVGNNLHLYEHLQLKYEGFKKKHLIKMTDQMPDYMKASELFISKPGGLSSTEAAVSNIPFVIVNPIPGCEDKNAQFFTSHKMAYWAKDIKNELLPCVVKALDRENQECMLFHQQKTINPYAARDLVDYIEKK